MELGFRNTSNGSVAGVKLYKALISQNGTNSPTAVVLENSLNITPTFKKSITEGQYTLKITSDLFLEDKTYYNGIKIYGSISKYSFIERVSDSEFSIFSFDTIASDSVIDKMSILIEVYP